MAELRPGLFANDSPGAAIETPMIRTAILDDRVDFPVIWVLDKLIGNKSTRGNTCVPFLPRCTPVCRTIDRDGIAGVLLMSVIDSPIRVAIQAGSGRRGGILQHIRPLIASV